MQNLLGNNTIFTLTSWILQPERRLAPEYKLPERRKRPPQLEETLKRQIAETTDFIAARAGFRQWKKKTVAPLTVAAVQSSLAKRTPLKSHDDVGKTKHSFRNSSTNIHQVELRRSTYRSQVEPAALEPLGHAERHTCIF